MIGIEFIPKKETIRIRYDKKEISLSPMTMTGGKIKNQKITKKDINSQIELMILAKIKNLSSVAIDEKEKAKKISYLQSAENKKSLEDLAKRIIKKQKENVILKDTYNLLYAILADTSITVEKIIDDIGLEIV